MATRNPRWNPRFHPRFPGVTNAMRHYMTLMSVLCILTPWSGNYCGGSEVSVKSTWTKHTQCDMLAALAAMSTAQFPLLGSLLRRYRRQAGLTQQALAERAAMSVRGIQDLERGVSRTPRQGTVDLLATALGLSATDRARLVAAAGTQTLPTARSSQPARRAHHSLIPLVGRSRELALLEQFLAEARDEPEIASLFLLAGEPGMGKTRLLEAAGQAAIGQGWRVLVGGCHRHGGQDPYAPIQDALTRYLQALTPDQLSAELEGCAWLARLLPELTGLLEPLPTGTVPADQERRLMFAAVRRLMANAAGPAGTLLLLDDLQWAGADALDLLTTLLHLARSELVSGAPLRVVGAYRDTDVGPGHPFGLVLADLAQSGLAEQHTLGPLDRPEAAALLTDLLIDLEGDQTATIEAVLERADGTPFYLVSYAQALRLGNQDQVPWSLAQGIRQRMAQVPQAREVLGAAAVIGRQVPRALLLAVVGQPEEAMLEALEAACGARLLLEKGEDAYVFAHDLIREVVEDGLGAARRAVLHRRVAETLELTPGAPPELLAYHYSRSDAQDKALEYLERAGDHDEAQRAHGSAEAHYRELLDRLDRLGREPDAARVREKLGEVLSRTGQYEAALTLLEGAAGAFRAAGDLESLTRTTVQIGQVYGRRGTSAEGVGRMQSLLQTLDGSLSSLLLAPAYATLGLLLHAAGRYPGALAANERAIELAQACGDDRTRALAEWNRVNCLAALGRDGEAQCRTEEVLPLIEIMGDLDMLSRAHHDLAYMYGVQGAFETGRMHIDRALAAAEQLADAGQQALALALRGWLAFLLGDWEQARRDLELAVALSDRLDRSWYSTYPLLFLARLRLAQGDDTDAARPAGEAIALAEQNTDLQALCWASGVMAECEILEGHPEAAATRLVSLLDRPGMVEDDATAVLPVLASAQLEQGRLGEAAETVERALTRARQTNLQIVLVEALWVQAMVMARKRCWQEAARNIEEGLALARGMAYPYAEARLLQLDGDRLAAQGDPTGARERVDEARAIFQRLGARWDAERVEQDMMACR